MPLSRAIALHGWLGGPKDWHHPLAGIKASIETPSLASIDVPAMLLRLQQNPVWLIGYSMGGRVALHLWQSLRGRLPGLILISARLRGEDLEKRSREEARWCRWLSQSPKSFFSYWDALELFKGSKAPDRASLFQKGERQRQVRLMQTWPLRRTHLSGSLFAPEKVHLLAGEWEEHLVQAYQNEPACHLHVLKGASHRLLHDKPEECRALLQSTILG